MNPLWWPQIKAVVHLEMKKSFLSRRGLWVYLLALAPVALFLAQSLVQIHFHGVRRDMASQGGRQLREEDLRSIHTAMTRDEVVAKLGPPPVQYTSSRRIRQRRPVVEQRAIEVYRYSDGTNELVVNIQTNDGLVVATTFTSGISFGQNSYVFAGVFQFFFIRLAVFFGCLGIFMNLFRGEMLNKSLHFYLLAPIRREILLVGKYLAGLLAASVIFTVSVGLQMIALSLQFDSNIISRFLYQEHGLGQIGAYFGVTLLACIGYGSVFVAAGLLARNPILPAAIVLIWEEANPILPALLKKLSVIYYLKSLCPVQVPVDPGMPALLAMLVSNPDPLSGYIAVFGLLAVSLLFLLASATQVRKLEINYSTD